jgi:hypothetical protein
MDYNNIEEIVREYLSFRGTSSKGWNSIYCEVCGDGKRTKGPRGGWLFDNEIAFYNCFNCGIDGNFDPKREYPFSKDMYNILKSFNIPLKYCYQLINNYQTYKPREVTKPKIEFDFLTIPDYFYLLAEASSNNLIATKAIKHLIEERLIDPYDYPFFLSTGDAKSNNPIEINMAKTMFNRLIIPAYVDNKLIGYEGMALGNQSKKYISIGKNIIHGYNNIFGKEENIPLFVTEGFFDAYHFKGVAVLTNKITTRQIELLERVNRPKIIIPDRFNTHNTLANKALELGWGISFPHIKPYKDVSLAIKNYGIIYVINSAMENIKYKNSAKISLNIFNLR